MILLSGKFKGRKLKSPKGVATRPTTSLVRKALFDICKSYIEEARFLDLFAGTGAIGLEALSRGASHVTFIDQDREALNCLTENIQILDCAAQTQILRGNSLLIMKKLKEPFDIIYIDPPYEKIPLSEILTFIDTSKLLNPGGHLFIETVAPSKEALEKVPFHHLNLLSTRKLGKTLLYDFFFS